MFKLIERSQNRLRFLLGSGFRAGIWTLDRTSDAAEFTHLAFLIPYRRTRWVLSEIKSVVVTRKEGGKFYYPVLEGSFGRNIAVGGYGKQDALKATHAIRDFIAA